MLYIWACADCHFVYGEKKPSGIYCPSCKREYAAYYNVLGFVDTGFFVNTIDGGGLYQSTELGIPTIIEAIDEIIEEEGIKTLNADLELMKQIREDFVIEFRGNPPKAFSFYRKPKNQAKILKGLNRVLERGFKGKTLEEYREFLNKNRETEGKKPS